MLHATRHFGSTGAQASVARQFRAWQVQKLARELSPEQQRCLRATVATLSMQWWIKAYQDSCRTKCSILVDALLIVAMAVTKYQQPSNGG
jgi:hypothetical protein